MSSEVNAIAYPEKNIWINGRAVAVESILSKQTTPASSFELTTFELMRRWLSGEQTFTLTTSGSTGKPKEITAVRDQIRASALATLSKLGIRRGTSALVCIDTKFVGGMMMVVRCLEGGLKMFALDPSANPLARLPVDSDVRFAALVPYQIRSLLESKHPHLLDNLDTVLIGGAALDKKSRDKLDRYQSSCYETYGMTETLSHVALRLANTRMKQQYYEGLPGFTFDTDERGCLTINSPFLKERVVTNDLVKLVAADKFEWLGRIDNVINTGGLKVLPEKVENALISVFERNNINNRFFIAGIPDEKFGEKVVLIVEGVQFSSEKIKQSLADPELQLSSHELPREIYSTPSFVATESLKINRIQSLAGVIFHSSIK